MSNVHTNHPEPITGNSNQLKKSAGRLVIKINSEILEFLAEKKKVKSDAPLSAKGIALRDAIKEKILALQDTLRSLEDRPGYISQEQMEKTVKMIKDNISTAQKALDDGSSEEEIVNDVTSAKDAATEVIEEVETMESLAATEMVRLTATLSSLASVQDITEETVAIDDTEEAVIRRELAAIGSYQAERFGRMKKEITDRMSFHKEDLLTKWKEQKDILDYQALKEMRSEFEGTHRKVKYMVSEWERRKYSDRLSDLLMDLIDDKFDEYIVEFRKMDEEKRLEAAVLRKRNLELEEYKREKRRAVPTWPSSLPYSKFKPDLRSWDQEHHLSSGSVKFGLLAEMLKGQGRITVYEQIQTRLGKNRNDPNIIAQVLTLLDAINEETVFNKLCAAWDDLANLKKEKNQTLNDFFSKFETLQYSLNLADDTFIELEPVKEGKELKYYEEREKMGSRKVELNDKLKAVHLIKALGVDENHRRDILAKVNFNKEPKEVYEETKTAIRDICGDKNNEADKRIENELDDVHIVKPWQNKDSDKSRSRPRYSRSRSRDYNRQSRSREDTSRERGFRSYSRDSNRSRERSDSRGRSRRRSTVSFQDRSRRERGRDSTPGESTQTVCNIEYDKVYLNEQFFKNQSQVLGQFMIVDSGCPRSLMGDKEYEKLRSKFKTESMKLSANERFRFGPSKTYNADFKVKIPMRLGDLRLNADFFIVKGEIPILLGNDVMKPLEGSIDMKEKKLKLQKIGKDIPLIETPGGHFVIPVKSIAMTEPSKDHTEEEAFEYEENIKGEEADEVMMTLVAECENKKDLKKVHNEIGHSAFVYLALTDEEEKQVDKVHRYFGHRSARRTWELFAKAEKLKGKRKEVLEIIEKCKICSQMKKAPPRPKVGLPVSNDFNEVVGMDLKVVSKSKGEYILWMVDLFSKMIKGKFIKDKKPSTIIEAIIATWIIGDGAGPGHPRRGFWTDNGGEFLNDELINFAAAFDISLKMTSAESPWQNGVVERHHATADIIFEKMMLENPKMSPQEAINHASFAKNSEVNKTRFSALQLMMGQSPHFPGLAETNLASSNLKSSSKYMKTLKNIDDARVKYRELECNDKLKKVLGEKINPNVEKSYDLGDPVFFYDEKKKEWKRATALVRLGKTVYLRFGNFLRRVPVEKVRPDYNGEIDVEEGYIEPDEEDDRFAAEETPVQEMARDLNLAEEISNLKKQLKYFQDKELKDADLEKNKTEEKEMEKEEIKEEKRRKILEERKLKKKKLLKDKKDKENGKFPKLSQQIAFREKGSATWKYGRVVKTFKKSSKYKNRKQLDVENEGRVEYDFEIDIAEWKEYTEDHINEEAGDDIEEVLDNEEILETFLVSEILGKTEVGITDQVFPVKIVPRNEYHRSEIQEAMAAEIIKYRDFKAFEEVEDEGQHSIPIRWVVTEPKDDGKNQPYKARLCIRGDLERGKESIRADSPTASKETLKLGLIIAANEGFEPKSADIKSAYLQGKKLQRRIYVRPPPEAKAEGKLWLLLQGAYGIMDGGRLFYLQLAEKLEDLGLHKVHSDGAMFTYVKDQKLQGLVISHVDDLILAGNATFKEEVEDKLKEFFTFSKIEEKSFTYCGCRIVVEDDGSIELDQNEYIDSLKRIDHMEGSADRELSEKEKKDVRAKIGELLWISLMTRPDISYDINAISSEVSRATVKTAKDLNKIVRKAKDSKTVLKFSKLGHINDLIVKVFADASFGNQDDGTRSTGGRVVLLENKDQAAVNIASWKTKKIARVCRSVKAAETRALEDAIDEAVNTARLIKEIYSGIIDLKNPAQIPVEAVTDCKSLWESIHNSKQCEEKILRNSIAGIKELISLDMVKSVKWVPTDQQLADCMTKKGKKADWLLNVASTNELAY